MILVEMLFVFVLWFINVFIFGEYRSLSCFNIETIILTIRRQKVYGDCGVVSLSSPFDEESFDNQDLDGQKEITSRFTFLNYCFSKFLFLHLKL